MVSSTFAVSGLIINTFVPELAKNRERVSSQTISLAICGNVRVLKEIDCAWSTGAYPANSASVKHNPTDKIDRRTALFTPGKYVENENAKPRTILVTIMIVIRTFYNSERRALVLCRWIPLRVLELTSR